MVSKRTLGTAYLGGTGLALGVVLVSRLFVLDDVGLRAVADTSVGFLLAGALVAAASWLDRSTLDGERVWRIAQWGGVGIGALLLAGVLIVLAHQVYGVLTTGVANVAITNVAAGGMGGVLFGTIRELRKENERVRGLNERNRVLGRVLRHNIQNEMTVVMGYAEVLADRFDAHGEEEVERMVAAAENVVDLGRKARRAERALEKDLELEIVDAAEVVQQAVERARERGVDVTLPPGTEVTAPVAASEHLDAVVENVIENAAEHAGEDPHIEVSVERDPDAGTTDIRFADDGPGIPESEVAVLADGGERPLSHGSGLGLWLVKWQVDRYGGELSFSQNEPRGSVVTIELESAG